MAEKPTKKKKRGSLKSYFKSLPRWISFPFLILLAAVALPLLFDENGYYESSRQDAQIRDLKKEVRILRDSVEYYRSKSRAIDTRPEAVERVAREQFHMKRPNEDLYLTEIK